MSQDSAKENSDDQKSPSDDRAEVSQTNANVATNSLPYSTDAQRTNKPSTIQQLTDSHSEQLCAICLDPITDRTVADPCLHAFCRRCIEQSLEHTSQCPICRRQIIRIRFNIRGPLDYDQREVEERIQTVPEFDEDDLTDGNNYILENDRGELNNGQREVESDNFSGIEIRNALNLVRNVRENGEHPENDAQFRQHLIENPREFVTVDVGQESEYLLPAWTIGRMIQIMVILTDSRGVYRIEQNEDEHGEYRVSYLQPNQVHLFLHVTFGEIERLNSFIRLVSPDRLGSAIHEMTNQRDRYERQPQHRQPQQQIREVGRQNNRESDGSSQGKELNDETDVSDSRVVDEPDDDEAEE